MQMNAGLILAGQQPDFVNVLRQSNLAASEANQVQRQNALNQLYQTQGADIAAGDQNALNALAQFDPRAALGIQSDRLGMDQTRLGMDATRQGMTHADKSMDILTAQEQRAIQTHAASLSAAERAVKADRIKQGLMQGIAAFQAGDLQGLNSILTASGEQPISSLEEFPGVAVKYDGVLAALSDVREFNKPDEVKPADEYQRYVQEEAAAGREPLSRIDYAQAKKGKGTVVYDPQTGRPLVSIGGGNDDPTDVSNPSSPAAMVSSIDGLLADPALATSTGVLSFMQAVPGTDQRRVGARIKQLDGQAFLQAFESLKGGGQITEIEGQKATQAIGRLDSAQKTEDYRQALTELRDILAVAAGRPVGWAEQQSATPADIPAISDEQGYNALPSGAVFTAPDGTQRRKP